MPYRSSRSRRPFKRRSYRKRSYSRKKYPRKGVYGQMSKTPTVASKCVFVYDVEVTSPNPNTPSSFTYNFFWMSNHLTTDSDQQFSFNLTRRFGEMYKSYTWYKVTGIKIRWVPAFQAVNQTSITPNATQAGGILRMSKWVDTEGKYINGVAPNDIQPQLPGYNIIDHNR